MARARRAALMLAGVSLAGVLGGGCAAPGPRPVPAPEMPVAAAARLPAPGDDWRALPAAPFGSRLQDLPFALHEVLLFHDREAAGDAPPAAERECYAPDGAPPRFVGREPDSYLMCYAHGRLERIEALLDLPAADAAARFAALCDAWQAGTVAIRPRTALACDGQQQPPGIAFSALLDEPANDGTTDPATVSLSMTVFQILPPDGP